MGKKSYNPFTPRFGKIPPEFVGRSFKNVFDAFLYAIDETADGIGSCYMRISGQRGMGKTATIAEMSRMAMSRGYRVIRTYALNGFTRTIIDEISDDAIVRKRIEPHIALSSPDGTSLSLSAFAIEKEIRQRSATLDQAFKQYFDNGGTDLLIVIDEVQDASGDIDIDALGMSIQTLETSCPDSHVGVVFAGLPIPILDMADINNEKRATFLTRSDHFTLELASDKQVAGMYKRAFAAGSKQISSNQLMRMAHESGGYPYMIQCIGFEAWKASGDIVSDVDVETGIKRAERRFFENVIMKIVGDMPDSEIRFLMALPDTDGPICLSHALAGTTLSRASVSRARASLLSKNILSAPKRGYVICNVSYLIRYMKKYGNHLLTNRAAIPTSD